MTLDGLTLAAIDTFWPKVSVGSSIVIAVAFHRFAHIARRTVGAAGER
jgi:hypothetical protein